MLRNREIRRFALLLAAITAAAAAVGFAIHLAAGFMALILAAAFGIAFLLFTRARYQRLARIAEQIDLVLHDADHLYIGGSDEGELSILESEITKMTLRIREQNDALKREKKLLADSLADIAHQLRTPLTSANLILSLLKNHPEEKERAALLRETGDLFIRMEWLIDSLLKLSRLDAGIVVFQSERINVRRLVADALRPFQIPMELHDIRAQIDVPVDSALSGDAGWLTEAIQNIVKNCMESAGDHGTIQIACEDNPLYTELTFHDSGPGFDRQEIPSLFNRFYRGKRPGAAGYGIGLALCKTIVIGQGGTVTAKNHPQGGAVFLMRFPK